jgi:FkbM family methyltransferase
MKIIQVVIGGHTIHFCPDGAPQWYDNNNRYYDLELIQPFIKPGDCVLDVGANHGLYALSFSKFVGPTGRVFAFEPLPRNLHWLRLNIDLNAAHNVTVIPYAMGSSLDEIQMTDEVPGKGMSFPATTLDQFAAFNPRVVKIDVEGWETHVLRGGTKVLEQRPAMMIETHEWLAPADLEELKTTLNAYYQHSHVHGNLLIVHG